MTIGRTAGSTQQDVWVGLVDVVIPMRGVDSSLLIDGAFFTQHTLSSGLVLTMRYTSRPALPDEPVAFPDWVETGDASETHNLAPSSDKWYLKINNESGALIYGDYMAPGSENRFVPIAGRLTGWLGVLTDGQRSASLFAAPERGGRRQVEIPAEGLTGPYHLDNAPIVADSERVWLVQLVDELEVARKRLTPSVDYMLDPRTGTLWLSRPLPPFNLDGSRNIIVVDYRVTDDTESGTHYGFHFSAGENADVPRSFTLHVGPVHGRLLTTLALEGRVPWFNERSHLTYELAGQRVEGKAGMAARVNFNQRLTDRIGFRGFASLVEGKLYTFGGNALPTGLSGEGRLEASLGDSATLAYVRGIRRTEGLADRHKESLILTFDTARVHHSFELRGEQKAGSERTLALLGQTDLSLSERQSFSLSGRLDFSTGGGHRIVLPATASYELSLSETAALNLAYQAAEIAPSGKSEWRLTLANQRVDGPSVYGGYSQSDARDEVFMGLRHAWSATPDLHLRANVQHQRSLGSHDPGSTTLSWLTTYTGLTGHEFGLKDDMVVSSQGVRHTLTLSGYGEITSDWSYSVYGLWHDPLKLTVKPVLTRELRVSVSYRDHEKGRDAIVAQALDRVYRNLTDGGDESARQVSVLAADWAHRVRNGIVVSNKLALHRTARGWHDSAGSASYSTNTVLYQLSSQVPLIEPFSVEVFSRHIFEALGTRSSGVAVEFVADLSEKMAVGVGYSSLGVNDPDLALVLPEWKEGVYIRLLTRF